MSALHVIRLRGPWEYAVLARFVPSAEAVGQFAECVDSLPPPGRVHMPTDWAASLGEDFRGRVEYRRKFGQPTGITSAERVWLVCDQVTASAAFTLNAKPLGETHTAKTDSPAFEFDITDQLAERNELVATVESSHQTGGLTGEVRLEIRSAG